MTSRAEAMKSRASPRPDWAVSYMSVCTSSLPSVPSPLRSRPEIVAASSAKPLTLVFSVSS